MNGSSLLLDTNIALYLLSGDRTIADLLHNKTIFISFITELELLGYTNLTLEEQKQVENFLAEAIIVDVNSEIKRIAITFWKSSKIKLPDAIIAASSTYLNIPLLTADKELAKLTGTTIILYEK
jgi:predicted nucleic acid-binding protein